MSKHNKPEPNKEQVHISLALEDLIYFCAPSDILNEIAEFGRIGKIGDGWSLILSPQYAGRGKEIAKWMTSLNNADNDDIGDVWHGAFEEEEKIKTAQSKIDGPLVVVEDVYEDDYLEGCFWINFRAHDSVIDDLRRFGVIFKPASPGGPLQLQLNAYYSREHQRVVRYMLSLNEPEDDSGAYDGVFPPHVEIDCESMSILVQGNLRDVIHRLFEDLSLEELKEFLAYLYHNGPILHVLKFPTPWGSWYGKLGRVLYTEYHECAKCFNSDWKMADATAHVVLSVLEYEIKRRER